MRVGVIFGGKSAEHEVSIRSARSVIKALDKTKYQVFPIGIDKMGIWHFYEPKACLPLFEKTALPSFENELALMPKKPIQVFESHLDVVFPVLHGPMGEDGTVQGLLKLFDVPFVGPSILGSSVAMDKDVTKRLFLQAGLPTAKFIALSKEEPVEWETFPCFVKPANLGSSVGISKVHTKDALSSAIKQAFLFDRKVLIEEEIKGMEIECSVLGNENPRASLPARLIPTHEFYDYEAKYLDPDGAHFEIPALLPETVQKEIQRLAIKAYQTLCLEGMSRVDFFVRDDEIFINEVNTIPGFTEISLYPKMWEVSGLPYTKLLDELLELAVKRHQEEALLLISR